MGAMFALVSFANFAQVVELSVCFLFVSCLLSTVDTPSCCLVWFGSPGERRQAKKVFCVNLHLKS